MLSKGSMRPIKKILGGILAIAGIGAILQIKSITDLLNNYSIIFNIILIVSGYFLFISGRQE